jgi:hypothetical protein
MDGLADVIIARACEFGQHLSAASAAGDADDIWGGARPA